MAIEISVDGIPCMFDADALDDWRVMKLIARMQGGDIAAFVKFAECVFGSEQLDNIERQLAGEDGICKASDMTSFIGKAMDEAMRASNGEAKN